MQTEFLLFSASRSQLVREKIRPYLEKGFYVISDRFHDSSSAYQGYGRGLPVEVISTISNLAIGETVPDITFILDIPIEIAEQRRQKKFKGNLDRIENSDREFYQKVRNGYLEIAKKESRFKVLNGKEKIESLHKKIVNEIEKFELR